MQDLQTLIDTLRDRTVEKGMSAIRKVLIIDSDEEFRQDLIHKFGAHGDYHAVQVSSAVEGINIVKSELFDIVLLAAELTDLDGWEACKLIRKSGVNVPVVMLAEVKTDANVILGFDAGANDYIFKPFGFSVLLARLRAQLREQDRSQSALFVIGPYSFAPSLKTLTRDGQKTIKLREKEAAILKTLYVAAPNVVSRAELLHKVWGCQAGVSTHTLETHVYRLRQIIEPNPSDVEILVTENNGYKLLP